MKNKDWPSASGHYLLAPDVIHPPDLESVEAVELNIKTSILKLFTSTIQSVPYDNFQALPEYVKHSNDVVFCVTT